VNIHPIVMLFLSKALGERINKTTATGVLAATAGALLITFSLGGLLGNLLAIVGAFSFAGYLAAGRVVRSSVGTLGYVAAAYGAAALVTLGVSLALHTNLTDYK
jgi:drug/metabolite transporter (DMT)-like permease